MPSRCGPGAEPVGAQAYACARRSFAEEVTTAVRSLVGMTIGLSSRKGCFSRRSEFFRLCGR
jgi:hypothetical protein